MMEDPLMMPGHKPFRTKDLSKQIECCVDQVLYNICQRGPEFDLFPWLKQHKVMLMSYSSLGSDTTGTRRNCESAPVIRMISEQTGLSAAAIMLALI